MLHYYGIIALDLAREHSRDLEREAAEHRLAASARADGRPGRPRHVRGLIARPLRALSDAAHAVSEAACAAATRLEGRSA